MIRYPKPALDGVIGVTAPSSGVPQHFQPLLGRAIDRMISNGYQVVCGETVRSQFKAKSAPSQVRAAELNAMLQDPNIDLILPPWGGELLIEVLEYIDFERLAPKWIMGYSDISLLLLAVTLKTGIATAHGPNLVDLRGEQTDQTTAMWEKVLSASEGESILQRSSPAYQKQWPDRDKLSNVFDLTEPTRWCTVGEGPVSMKGRLLGGCIDVIRHLIGTPYGDVARFRETQLRGEPIIWYLENCELNTADLRRSLVHMKYAGWFDGCAGLLFGRSPANQSVDGYTAKDVYEELSEELRIPVVYDMDCGHQPPQLTLVNGCYAEITSAEGKGSVRQYFKP